MTDQPEDRDRDATEEHSALDEDLGVEADQAIQVGVSVSRVKWMLTTALAVVVIAAVVAIVAIMQSTVPKSDLEKVEADLAETRQRAASDASAAAEARAAAEEAAGVASTRITALESQVGDLQQSLSGLEGDVAERDDMLADARSEADALAADLGAAREEVEAAGTTIMSAAANAERLTELSKLYLAWVTWWSTNEQFFEEAPGFGADLAPIDGLLSDLGLSDTWETWSGTDFILATRTMDRYLRNVDSSEVEAAFRLWVLCEGNEECLVASVALESAIFSLEQALLTNLADTLGIA